MCVSVIGWGAFAYLVSVWQPQWTDRRPKHELSIWNNGFSTRRVSLSLFLAHAPLLQFSFSARSNTHTQEEEVLFWLRVVSNFTHFSFSLIHCSACVWSFVRRSVTFSIRFNTHTANQSSDTPLNLIGRAAGNKLYAQASVNSYAAELEECLLNVILLFFYLAKIIIKSHALQISLLHGDKL